MRNLAPPERCGLRAASQSAGHPRIYDHARGDGRELCVSDPAAVKVRAASGRHVPEIDISPYVCMLPDGSSTRRFTSENASGSTSQGRFRSVTTALISGECERLRATSPYHLRGPTP
jgi:hypothetical protein